MTAFFCKKIALYVFQYAFLLAAVPVLPISKRLVFHKPQLWFIHFTAVVFFSQSWFYEQEAFCRSLHWEKSGRTGTVERICAILCAKSSIFAQATRN